MERSHLRLRQIFGHLVTILFEIFEDQIEHFWISVQNEMRFRKIAKVLLKLIYLGIG